MRQVRAGPLGLGLARREYIKASTSGGVVKLHIYMFTIDVESNGEVAEVLSYQIGALGVEPTNVDIRYGLYLVVPYAAIVAVLFVLRCSSSSSFGWKYERVPGYRTL